MTTTTTTDKLKDWVSYKNGNYFVFINLESGTKVRANSLDSLIPDTIESMDLKITNKCNRGCLMCHENSTPDGKHADLFAPSFLDKLHPYTELAIGGGNPLEHPDLEKFLELCKERKFIPSMTVNQRDFIEQFDYLMSLRDKKLIYGLGVSLTNPSDEFIEKCKEYGPKLVIHVINGLTTVPILGRLSRHNLKVLILGYKIFRRGKDLYRMDKSAIESLKRDLKTFLPTIIEEKWFDVVSFDNLALKQLDVKSILPKDVWKSFYMGDDGIDGEATSASMFVDLVERKFARNSCSEERFDLLDTAEEMYERLK